MLKLRRKGSTISVETMGGILTWDARRGGQITGLIVKDELFSHPLLAEGCMLPDLELTIDGERIGLSEVQAEMDLTQGAHDYARIMTRATLGGHRRLSSATHSPKNCYDRYDCAERA